MFGLAPGAALATSSRRASAQDDGIVVVMYRRAGCPWCHAWDREIGAIWPKSDVGARHPVRMVDLDQDERPALALDLPVHFTPTFVVAVAGTEIGRIEGYPGQDFFWGLIERLIADAERAAGGSPTPAPAAGTN
ncbi:thioredoxin family protein [Salinarimonas ramus]|uniref:Uncharacterized protein n=1 Tax=Salinarimonas ramus TaxID=690164 RepID=A0A917Q609_9HYPH|nr:thioredoxin family protein [Salinarimonas ramus]GGK28647.1 hypothetical protein GCM10011322_13870 [Salinarimonas ramus]